MKTYSVNRSKNRVNFEYKNIITECQDRENQYLSKNVRLD